MGSFPSDFLKMCSVHGKLDCVSFPNSPCLPNADISGQMLSVFFSLIWKHPYSLNITPNSYATIIPVMCGESSVAKELSQRLMQDGVMAGAIVFPMVAKDKARVRTQMSAGLSSEDLDEVLSVFEKHGSVLGLI